MACLSAYSYESRSIILMSYLQTSNHRRTQKLMKLKVSHCRYSYNIMVILLYYVVINVWWQGIMSNNHPNTREGWGVPGYPIILMVVMFYPCWLANSSPSSQLHNVRQVRVTKILNQDKSYKQWKDGDKCISASTLLYVQLSVHKNGRKI